MGSRQGCSSLLCTLACVVGGCRTSPPVLPVGLITTIQGAPLASARHDAHRCAVPQWRPQGVPVFGRLVTYGLAERIHHDITQQRTYPEVVRRYGWQGTVQLCVMMEPDGRFSRVTVVSSSGNAFLDNEAVRLLQSMQITNLPSPATWTQLWFQIPIAYELTDLAPSDQAVTQAVKTRVLQHREYPAEAIPSKLEGNTVLGATVGPDGSLQDIRVYQPSGSEILDQAAKTLLERSVPFPMQHWQFGSPVHLLIPVAYRFERSSP